MSRLVRKPATLFSIAIVVALIPIFLRIARVAAVTAMAPVDAAALEVAMIRAGLDPMALAAAGVSSVDAVQVVDDFEAELALSPTALSRTDADVAAARAESDRLQRLIRSGRGVPADVTSYQSEQSSLATAEAARVSALDSLFDAGVASMTAGQVTLLGTIRANRHWPVPIEFTVVGREESEWVNVRDSVDAERISAKDGETLDPDCASRLATWRAVAAVSTAKTGCDSNFSAIETAWKDAIEN